MHVAGMRREHVDLLLAIAEADEMTVVERELQPGNPFDQFERQRRRLEIGMDVRLDGQRDPRFGGNGQEPLQARGRLRQRLLAPLPRIDDARQHEDHADAGAHAEADRLLQVGDVLVEVSGIGQIAVRERRAEEVIEAGQIDPERLDLVGDALRLGQQLRLVERRPVEIADVERIDAERLRDRRRFAEIAGRQRPGRERELEGHHTFSMRPLSADRYIASSTSTARMPTSPGALFSTFTPRQRPTSTRSGASQL